MESEELSLHGGRAAAVARDIWLRAGCWCLRRRTGCGGGNGPKEVRTDGGVHQSFQIQSNDS